MVIFLFDKVNHKILLIFEIIYYTIKSKQLKLNDNTNLSVFFLTHHNIMNNLTSLFNNPWVLFILMILEIMNLIYGLRRGFDSVKNPKTNVSIELRIIVLI